MTRKTTRFRSAMRSQIAAGGRAELIEAPGVGHHGILSSEQMRAALTSLLVPQDLYQSPPREAVQ